MKILLFIINLVFSVFLSYIVYNQTERLSDSTSLQFENANKERNKLLTELNAIRNNILKDNNKNIINIQAQNNLITEKIKDLQLAQNKLIESKNNLDRRQNEISLNYTNIYKEIEKIKKETLESKMLIDFIAVSANAMKCSVKNSSELLSFGGTKLFNTLEDKKSKILLLDFLSNLPISYQKQCNKSLKITLKGINLNNLNLYGVNVNNLYCENCKADSAYYSFSYYTYNLDKKDKEKCKTTFELSAKNSIAIECNWKYSEYDNVRYFEIK